jgi:hypothetical protein
MESKCLYRSQKLAKQRSQQIAEEHVGKPQKFEYLFEDAKRRNEHKIQILSQVKDKDCTFKPNREYTYKFQFRRGSTKKDYR